MRPPRGRGGGFRGRDGGRGGGRGGRFGGGRGGFRDEGPPPEVIGPIFAFGFTQYNV